MKTRWLTCAAVVVLACGAAQAQSGAPRCPNMLVVFDVSGSMRDPAPNASGGTSPRYVVGRDAVKALVMTDPDHFRFGLELFGDVAAGSSCGVSSPTCFYPSNNCNSVLSDYGTAADIAAVLDGLSNSDVAGSTPTGPAVSTAAQRSDMNDAERPRYIILLTDGDPSGCTSGGQTAMEMALSAINDIREDLGVKTFVLGFAGGSASNLNQMAEAGGTARFPGECNSSDKKCYYEANNAAELQSALNAIISVVGGELGGGAICDDTCYGQGCPSGQVCINAQCSADPCAGVTCGENEACVNGVCEAFCPQTCLGNTYCKDGQCVEETGCPGGCPGRNQTCVGGQCVEDHCSGEGPSITCPATHVCYKNGCHLAYSPPGEDGGTNGGGGPGGGTDEPAGCCTGAPGAANLIGGLFLLIALRGRRGPLRPAGRSAPGRRSTTGSR